MDGRRVTVSTREYAVGILRLAITVQLLVILPLLPLTPWSGPVLIAMVSAYALMIAAPLALFHPLICRRESPFLQWGYVLVILYGPVAVLMLRGPAALFSPAGVFMLLVYEVAALAVALAYAGMWRLGDRWFGDIGHPRRRRRWVLAVAIAGLLCVGIPYLRYTLAADDCLDRGGSYRPGGWCNVDPNDHVNNGPWTWRPWL